MGKTMLAGKEESGAGRVVEHRGAGFVKGHAAGRKVEGEERLMTGRGTKNQNNTGFSKRGAWRKGTVK